jgi:CRISPR-associated protein Cmr2
MTAPSPPSPSFYPYKLYALLRSLENAADCPSIQALIQKLACFQDAGIRDRLETWWTGSLYQAIADSSDRVNLHPKSLSDDAKVQLRHPISGEQQSIDSFSPIPISIPSEIATNQNAEQVFWWFWRFYPELLRQRSPDALLFPAHRILPDCPLHSYQATVSALVGAIGLGEAIAEPSHPYLLLFTFSPIQEFIKASRKFVDFWAGSYLLHYLSAKLCWYIAQKHGPDAVVVPSLWGQEIFDALMLQHYQNSENPEDCEFATVLANGLREIGDRKLPVERFSDRSSTSLSTAGFPNMITALVPGKEAAQKLGEDLARELKEEWQKIGKIIRDHIRETVSQEATDILSTVDQEDPRTKTKWQALWQEINPGGSERISPDPYLADLRRWRSQLDQAQLKYSGWEWNKLWEHQLGNTWEPYWAAVPLGVPGQELTISKEAGEFNQAWREAQQTLAQAWIELPNLDASESQTLPLQAEAQAFQTLNVGTWWGSLQQRLRLCVQAVKNTRAWEIPVAPGERSTISGQFSAVHPSFNYTVVRRDGIDRDLREGGGLPEGSMRLFWLLMSKAYPGLFNGSERLNALEITKRMAWIYGGVADSLGIPVSQVTRQITAHRQRLSGIEIEHEFVKRLLYDRFLRFPNLSSIAAARFIHNYPEETERYWVGLNEEIKATFGSTTQKIFHRFTRVRPSQIPKTDQAINPLRRKKKYFNGAMFSSKWLAEDLNLDQVGTQSLRGLVDQAHKNNGFGEGSPSDWWAIALADGDNMGRYISGSKLKTYENYVVDELVDWTGIGEGNRPSLLETQKRMGPATHVGLNRALLDFSNRLVPYLTERRFCGKVVYSGGDDVLVLLPLEDLPEYLLSLRAAWCGDEDPYASKDQAIRFENRGGYWKPHFNLNHPNAREWLPDRSLFTMGEGATLSMGVVIAYKSVPLPTVLESLWEAEGDRAKEMPGKDGICFRVIYGGGNRLEALMKGNLLQQWWNIVGTAQETLSPLLYRLAEELPQRVDVDNHSLFSKAASVIMSRRDENRQIDNFEAITEWLDAWGAWAFTHKGAPGTEPKDLGYLLRFSAFWVDKMVQRQKWTRSPEDE